MQASMRITSAEQFKALGHPFRQRLLFALGEPATLRQLTARLDAQKGNVAHHLKVLREAGMVRIVATRQVRGGTEQYFQRAARRLDLPPQEPGTTAAMFGAVAEELASADDDPLVILRHVRLTAAQADRLRAGLTDLIADLEPAGPEEARFGMLVSLYQEKSI
ncbi:helix-turn-helix domain-containing protein [Longispora sp. K20-0274]|uniref:ArsR/SmtB family transcription factor n=1 Tax=Longispora sp. K20-0274 TaxID=3088255 RepID=UPI00399BADA0